VNECKPLAGGDTESGTSIVRAQMELKVRLVLRAAAPRTAVVRVVRPCSLKGLETRVESPWFKRLKLNCL